MAIAFQTQSCVFFEMGFAHEATGQTVGLIPDATGQNANGSEYNIILHSGQGARSYRGMGVREKKIFRV
jgi:hypothetical protein